MKLRIHADRSYETYNVSDNDGNAILVQFHAQEPFRVHTDGMPGPWGEQNRTVHYNAVRVNSIEVLD